jgi:protein phosphatase
MRVDMTVAARSDVGMIRSGNEDSFFVLPSKERGLFIVADGMGGHAAGEVASEMAVQIIARELNEVKDLHSEGARDRLGEAIRIANRAIYDRTIAESDKQGMGTTAQARYHPYSNVITRCVGASEEVEPDTFPGELRVGDVFLVASDGLTGMVDDRRLQQLLLSRASAGRVVDALIAEANYRGGLDNITAVVVQITAIDSPQSEERTDERPAVPD